MELKIHVDQTIRIVCGLSEETSVHEVIVALAHALKQTGRFYLVEFGPNRMQRVMSPSERPIHLLKTYSSNNHHYNHKNVEFHLIRTSLEQPNGIGGGAGGFGEDVSSLSGILMSINRQQCVLNEQSHRLNDVLESIRMQEAKNGNRLDEDYMRRKLFHLDLKSKLNERKLKKMDAEISEVGLKKETELNEFLKAQIDYYQR